jgi:hypothetical protein
MLWSRVQTPSIAWWFLCYTIILITAHSYPQHWTWCSGNLLRLTRDAWFESQQGCWQSCLFDVTFVLLFIISKYKGLYKVLASSANCLYLFYVLWWDRRLCGLVVRVLGYRSGVPGSIPGTTRKKLVVLERGPFSLVSTTEELLDRKVAAPV